MHRQTPSLSNRDDDAIFAHLCCVPYQSCAPVNKSEQVSLASIMSFPGQALQRAWHLVDASNQTVGRLAGQVAQILRGKHKPTYQPNKDMGDFVVVINAEKVCIDRWDDDFHFVTYQESTHHSCLSVMHRSLSQVTNGSPNCTDGIQDIPVGSNNEEPKKCWNENQRRF